MATLLATIGPPSLAPHTASHPLYDPSDPSAMHVDDAKCAFSAACPNVLMVLSDDHGHTDLGVMGIDATVDTPVLDRLASKGARFEFGYATAPQCTPSRAGLLSGRNQNTFGLYDNDADVGYGVGVLPPRPKVVTISERVREFGYVTGMSGKWHLGAESDATQNPGGRGFDEYLVGMIGRWHTNLDPTGRSSTAVTLVQNRSNRIDVSADFAELFLTRHRTKRFFYYWAPFGPHEPMLEDGDPYLEAFPMPRNKYYTDEENDRRRRGLALIKAIDTRLGGILDVLRRHALEESTLILFASDNGAPMSLGYDKARDHFSRVPMEQSSYAGSDNVPLRGAKGFLWEGGIRVPMLAYWKDTIPSGQVIAQPVTTLDFTATIADAVGLKASRSEGFDGQSLLPGLVSAAAPTLVARPGGGPDGVLKHFWASKTGDSAVRSGDWKLRRCRSPTKELVYLFNITEDPLELRNLVEENKQVHALLTSRLDKWEAGLPFTVACRADGKETGEVFIWPDALQCTARHVDPRMLVGSDWNGPASRGATCFPAPLE